MLAGIALGIGLFGKANRAEVSYSLTRDAHYGSTCLNTSIEDFRAAGFTYGDSVDVVFSNGTRIEDIPYYNGYYGKTGDLLMIGYPGNGCVNISYNCGESSWDRWGLSADDTATVSVHEAGKYRSVQELFAAEYSNDRSDYADDSVFANFRSLSGGAIKENTFFRGCSPLDNTYNRAGYVDALMRDRDIRFVLDLSDSADEVEGFMASDAQAGGSLFAELSEAGNAVMLGLTSAYRTQEYAQSLADGLRAMMKTDGNCYIHCIEGKDRTGWVCVLLEALSGADYGELERDYMLTYENYYGISRDETPDKYQAYKECRFDDMIEYLARTDAAADVSAEALYEGACAYLEYAGMSPDEIRKLAAFLTE